MASKRAAQLFGARSNASVIGQRTTRLSFTTARAFSIAPNSPTANVLKSRSVVVESAGRLQAIQAQKRWHSQAPNDLKQNKLYQFDDVRLLIMGPESPPNLLLIPQRSYTSSKPHQTHAFSSMSANPMNSRKILSPPP